MTREQLIDSLVELGFLRDSLLPLTVRSLHAIWQSHVCHGEEELSDFVSVLMREPLPNIA